LTILNSLGRIVHREPLMLAGEPPRIINTDHWSDGVYTLVLEGSGGQLVMRVVRY
jgi:hypothetical protein